MSYCAHQLLCDETFMTSGCAALAICETTILEKAILVAVVLVPHQIIRRLCIESSVAAAVEAISGEALEEERMLE